MCRLDWLRRSSIPFLLAVAIAVAASASGCSVPEEEEPTAESQDEIAIAIAIPVYLTVKEVIGLYLIGSALIVANYQFQTAISESDRSRLSHDYVSQVRSENQLIQDEYQESISSKLNVPREVTPNLWVQQFGYSREVAGNVATASRQLLRTAKTTRFRSNGGGCVIATVKHQSGTPYQGGAPFSSEFDVIAAQFSSAARAYTRCALSDPDTINAIKDFIPSNSLPSLRADDLVTYGIKSTHLLQTLHNHCNALSFAITSNKAACR